jgi:hypothetical protein
MVCLAVLLLGERLDAQNQGRDSKGPRTTPKQAMAPARRITGIVRDAKGEPLANALVYVNPALRKKLALYTHTDKQGRFTLNCRSRRLSSPYESVMTLIIQHKKRHLAGALQIDGSKKELDIKLTEAISVSGQVLDVKGKAIGHALVGLELRIGRLGYWCPRDLKVDSEGRYEIHTIPSAFPYLLSGAAEGYGEQLMSLHGAEALDGRVKLKPLVLAQADCSLSGTAVDVNKRPLAGVRVECIGDGQPNRIVTANEHGEFHFKNVCAGPIDVEVRGMRGRITANGGDQDIVIVAREWDAKRGNSSRKSGSLIGKATFPIFVSVVGLSSSFPYCISGICPTG